MLESQSKSQKMWILA